MNPEIKKDDIIIVTKFVNNQASYSKYVGLPLRVLRKSGNAWVCAIVDTPSSTLSVYTTTPADEFTFADKPSRIKFQKEKITGLKKELINAKTDLDFLIKYEDEEEYLADKLHHLFKANTVKARAQILRELRKTNFL